MYCLYIKEVNSTATLQIKHFRKNFIALHRLKDGKSTNKEWLINFEWKLEALKGTAKVLYC